MIAYTPGKEDLEKFISCCIDLEERGYSEDGVAYAMGFNNTVAFRAFKVVIERNLEVMREQESIFNTEFEFILDLFPEEKVGE